MTMKTLAIIGGTGKAGQQVIDEALARGYQLRVLARNPEKVRKSPNITVISGDARDKHSLRMLLDSADAVVSTLGPAGINNSIKKAKEAAKDMLCYNSTKTLLPLMAEQGISRMVLTGGASLKLPEDNNNFIMRFLLNKFAPKLLGDLAIDRHKEYQLLNESNIEWTIARCGEIIDKPSNKPLKTSDNKFQGGQISTHHLANFLLDQVEDKQFVRKGVFLAG
ncbi:NAD(P)H-binding protein [Vibrio sp. Of7-15]|uniref:NAD(P)-dependent oxidoreductase n=1 Tax=Vibrio sp. Of7-15 TaxID=2724879 RepID=UPI001EF24C49|nr:NAD(P)H-binding protein [Vibrio sp. Of7-15]MCG7497971.1 NAD(P)H-binding protein [Vibrio sp. Of7-15]